VTLAVSPSIADINLMRSRSQRRIDVALAALAFSGSAYAEPVAPPDGEQPQVAPSNRAVVWYRSSEGCPDGVAFLARLGERAPLARLAGGGDRIDFVVTLSAHPAGSQGRLERQTQGGTVAIREIEDTSCDNVADALALGLALALDPESTAQNPTLTATRPVPAPPVEPARESAPSSAPRQRTFPASVGPPAAPPAWQWLVGIEAGAMINLFPSATPSAAAFVELDRSRAGMLSGVSVRGGAVGLVSSSEQVQLWIAAAYLEACPLRLGEKLSVSACSSLDVGAIRASAGRADTALWVALEANGRVRGWVARRLALEAWVGAEVPVRRYQVVDASGTLFETGRAGLSGGLGVTVGLP
jgi:hypothetical protein